MITSSQTIDFALIGHSHSVAFLDGVTDWRGTLPQGPHRQDDPRYDQSFQGWFTGAFPDHPLNVAVTDPRLQGRSIQVQVITAASRLRTTITVEQRNGNPVLVPQERFLQALMQIPIGTPVVSFLNGNEHAPMMLGHLPPYDFVEEAATTLLIPPQATPIDSAVIDQHILPWVHDTLLTVATIQFVTQSPVTHVLPPPPRENPGDSRFLETIEALVRQHGFAPDSLRLKWHRRYCRLLAQALEGIGCAVLWPPPQCLTPEGLLASEFADGLTHGNARYGREVAQHIYGNLRRTA